MPKIQRRDIPRAVLEHLATRVQQREVGVNSLQQLAAWMDKNPTVPEGHWFKRFADFIVCGKGPLVLTILTKNQTAIGHEAE